VFNRIACVLAVLAALLVPLDGSGALLDGVGAMGDSLTDEYEFSGLSAGRNWLEQLALRRGVNFGSRSATPRPEPRRAGYEFNWARSGATSATLLSDGQHTGLAEQVAAGTVTLAYLGIGSNDFGFSYDSIYDGRLVGAGLDAFVAAIGDNVRTALDAVSARGPVKLVIGNVPDYGAAPTLRLLFPDAAKRKRVTDATVAANAKIRALAVVRGIPIVDLFAFANAIFLEEGRLVVGGVEIDLTGSGSDPRNLFLADGIHPGSVAQGLIANVFLEAIRQAYVSTVAARSDQEILRDAGITPPPGPETFYNVKRFVDLAGSPLVLTQVAVGGGYTTAFTLLNTGAAAAAGRLELFDTAGKPFSVRLEDGTTVQEGSSFSISIPVAGMRVYSAAREGALGVQNGWARIETTGGSVGAVATFALTSGSALRTIAGVLGAQAVPAATIPVENDDARERFTGFAVANPGTENIEIRLRTLAQDGSLVDDLVPDRLKLAAGAQTAVFLHEIVPGRLRFRGSMVLEATSGEKFSVVALVQASGLLTAIPVVPQKSPR